MKDIESYRYAIAKSTFLKVYSDFEFVKDIERSNCMVVLEKSTEKKLIISILAKPTPKNKVEKVSNEMPIIIYYRYKNLIDNYKGKHKNNTEVRLLNEKFIEMYRIDEQMAFLCPVKYQKNLPDSHIKLFNPLYIRAEKELEQYNFSLHKYVDNYCDKHSKFGFLNGNLGFTNPAKFNDPFDCQGVINNNVFLVDKVRVLCLTKDPKNILMWSYYANNHKGTCFAYKYKDLINSISLSDYDAIVFWGPVKYSKKRPQQKYISANRFYFTYLHIYLKNIFTKFEEWSHEQEFRFVMISAKDWTNEHVPTITVPIENIYLGCKGSSFGPIFCNSRPITPQQLSMDPDEYLLV